MQFDVEYCRRFKSSIMGCPSRPRNAKSMRAPAERSRNCESSWKQEIVGDSLLFVGAVLGLALKIQRPFNYSDSRVKGSVFYIEWKNASMPCSRSLKRRFP